MKKFFLFMVSTMVVATFLCACSKNATTSSNAANSYESSSAVVTAPEADALENCTLSEEQMLTVIEDYYKVFEVIMNKNGDAVTFEVEESSGAVSVRAVREEAETTALEWDTIKAAYEFLYSQGQVDIEGNLLITENDVIDGEGQ